jgi:hypothetical protein
MSHKTVATVAHTIGIDTGKNTLHLIGLDDWNGSNRPWRDGCCFRKPTSTPVVNWACEMTSPPS